MRVCARAHTHTLNKEKIFQITQEFNALWRLSELWREILVMQSLKTVWTFLPHVKWRMVLYRLQV